MEKRKIISAVMALAVVASQTMGGIPKSASKNADGKLTAYAYNESIRGKWLKDEATGKWMYKHLDGSYTKNGYEYINGLLCQFDENGLLKSELSKLIDKLRRLDPNNNIKYKFVDGADNWSFRNSSDNFGETYYMREDYWNKLMDGLKYTEKTRIIKNVQNGTWAGSCYGMAATSVLASSGILKPEKWQDNADFLHDIAGPPSDEVKSLINYYFSLQLTDYDTQKMTLALYLSEPYKLNKLIRSVEGGASTLLCFYGYFDGLYQAGHAVVAYDVEYDTFVKEGITYNGRIKIYDNNFIDFNEDYCLYFDTSDGSWAIPGYQLSSKYGDYLGLITNDIDFINHHGYIDGTEDGVIGKFIPTLQSAPIKSKYNISKSSNIRVGYSDNIASDDDIKVMPALGDNNFKNSSLMFALRDSAASYVLKLQEPEKIDLALSYENSLLSAASSSGAAAKFSPTDCVAVNGKNTDYELGIVLNEGYKVTDWYSFTVKGCGVNDAALRKAENGYILEATNLKNVSANAFNDDAKANVTFSTDYPKVFLYEKDENTIGVAVDTDNNGSFETEVKVN